MHSIEAKKLLLYIKKPIFYGFGVVKCLKQLPVVGQRFTFELLPLKTAFDLLHLFTIVILYIYPKNTELHLWMVKKCSSYYTNLPDARVNQYFRGIYTI